MGGGSKWPLLSPSFPAPCCQTSTATGDNSASLSWHPGTDHHRSTGCHTQTREAVGTSDSPDQVGVSFFSIGDNSSSFSLPCPLRRCPSSFAVGGPPVEATNVRKGEGGGEARKEDLRQRRKHCWVKGPPPPLLPSP